MRTHGLDITSSGSASFGHTPADEQQSSLLRLPRPKEGWGAEIAAWCCAASFMAIWIVGFVQVAEWLADHL
jgi:hypothetical protein